jgi:hypothetical protein
MGLSHLDAEGVIGFSSLYLVLQRARARLKNAHKIEIRKDFYRKTASSVSFLTEKAVSYYFVCAFLVCAK